MICRPEEKKIKRVLMTAKEKCQKKVKKMVKC